MAGPIIVARITADDQLSPILKTIALEVRRFSADTLKAAAAMRTAYAAATAKTEADFDHMANRAARAFDRINRAADGSASEIGQAARKADAFGDSLDRADRHAARVHDRMRGLARLSPAIGHAIETALVAGGAKAGHDGIEKALDTDTAKNALRATGASKPDLDFLASEAAAISGRYMTVAPAEVLHDMVDLKSTLKFAKDPMKARAELADMARLAAEARQSIKSVGGDPGSITDYFKSAELRGVSDPADLRKFLNSQIKAKQVLGKNTSPEQMRDAYKYIGASLQTLGKADKDDVFMQYTLPSLVQEWGGQQTGTKISTLFSALVGGKMTKQAAVALAELKYIDPNKIEYDKAGRPLAVKGRGVINNSDLLYKSPADWVEDYMARLSKLDPKMAGDSPEAHRLRTEYTQKAFSNKNAADFVTKVMEQMPTLQRHQQNFRDAKGLDMADTLPASAKFTGAWNQLTNVVAVAATPALEDLANAAERTAGKLGLFAKWLEEKRAANPETFKAVTSGLFAAAGVAATAWTIKALSTGANMARGLVNLGRGAALSEAAAPATKAGGRGLLGWFATEGAAQTTTKAFGASAAGGAMLVGAAGFTDAMHQDRKNTLLKRLRTVPDAMAPEELDQLRAYLTMDARKNIDLTNNREAVVHRRVSEIGRKGIFESAASFEKRQERAATEAARDMKGAKHTRAEANAALDNLRLLDKLRAERGKPDGKDHAAAAAAAIKQATQDARPQKPVQVQGKAEVITTTTVKLDLSADAKRLLTSPQDTQSRYTAPVPLASNPVDQARRAAPLLAPPAGRFSSHPVR